jgi:hypothetical protein
MEFGSTHQERIHDGAGPRMEVGLAEQLLECSRERVGRSKVIEEE